MGIGATLGHHQTPAVDGLQATHLSRAACLAYLLTGRRDVAERIAGKAFVRAYGSFQSVRDPWGFDLALRRGVYELARRECLRARFHALVRRQQAGSGEDGGGLWAGLQDLPMRRRAALVLLLGEGLSPAQAAEAMGCPSATVDHLAARALRDLAARLPRAELESGLRRLFEDRARSVTVSGAHSISSRARLRRLEVAGSWTVLLVTVVYVVWSASSVSLRPSGVEGERGTIRSYEQNRGYSLLRIHGDEPPAEERLAIAQGRIGPDEWALSAFKDSRSFLCMDVSLNISYRTLDCTAPALSGFHAFVTSSMPRDATFVYGDAAANVESLDFRLQPLGRHRLHVFRAPAHLRLAPGTSMYIAVIPKYMVRLASRAEARALGYAPLDGVLVGRDELGRVVQRTFIFMGHPKG